MALLAAYMDNSDRTLPDWLESCVFADMEKTTLSPVSDGVKGFTAFMERYKAGLAAEKAASEV